MEPKKFLFVSFDALITDIAWQISKEGHQVKMYTECPDEKEVGQGFIELVDSWRKFVD